MIIPPVHIGGLFATQCHHKRTACPLSGQVLCVAVVPILPELQSCCHRAHPRELGEIAHIKPLRADRAFFEMIGLDLSDAVAIVRADLTKKNPSRCRHATDFCNT